MLRPSPSEQRGGAAESVVSRSRWYATGVVLVALALLGGPITPSQALVAPNTTVLVSRALGPDGAKGNRESGGPSVSADGRFVAFASEATNLHPDATEGGVFDVFVRDLQENTTTLVSRATGDDGAKGNDASVGPSISADGRFVAFSSRATNLHPDLTEGGGEPGTVNQTFVRDLEDNITTLVSRDSGPNGEPSNHGSGADSISADGRFVTFTSRATNIHPDVMDKPTGFDDENADVFVRDLRSNTTTLVSRATGAEGERGSDWSYGGSISADGRFVAFTSEATNLHPDATDFLQDVYVRDLEESTTTLVSRASGVEGDKGDGYSSLPSISADGRSVAFESWATNLDPDAKDVGVKVFVRALGESTTTLVSRASGPNGQVGGPDSGSPSISADGRFVAFTSSATNLHPDANDTTHDVFVRDLRANTTALASRASGAHGAKADRGSGGPSISADGRFVAFASSATNLHPDATDDVLDVFGRSLSENRPAKLTINRARLRDAPGAAQGAAPRRRLVVRGWLDPAAAGERVVVRFRARGRQILMRPVVRPDGRFAFSRVLRGPQRRAWAGQLRVRFAGNDTLRAAGQRLRAARRAVKLRIRRVRLRGNRLAVAGQVRPRARRQARIQVEFNRLSGDPAQIATRARVTPRGRFRTRLQVPPAVENIGAWISITHPGRGPLFGQRRGRGVGG